MLNILKSEFLKTKHSGVWRDVVVIPLVAVVLATLMGDQTTSLKYFTSSVQYAVYWWEAIFLFLYIGLVILVDQKIESQAGDFQNVVGSGQEFKIYLAKIIIKIVCIVVGHVFLVGELLLVLRLVCHGVVNHEMTQWLIMTGAGMVLTVLWNIPLVYILARKINNYVVTTFNTLIGMFIVPVCGTSAVWVLVPYTYHYRLAENLCGVAINGTPITTFTQPHFAPCLLAIVVSALLFICLVVVLKKVITHGKNYSK